MSLPPMDLSLTGSECRLSTGSESDRSHSSTSSSATELGTSVSVPSTTTNPLLAMTPSQQAAAARCLLKFSIAAILSPRFGGQPGELEVIKTAEMAPKMPVKPLAKTPTTTTTAPAGNKLFPPNNTLWPAWVYCTRYSDRPSSGPRSRRAKRKAPKEKSGTASPPATMVMTTSQSSTLSNDGESIVGADEGPDEKRPRTAFTTAQLRRLKDEFDANPYLTEQRRNDLSANLALNENQIKIWFQNKRAKIKKQQNVCNPLQLNLMAQGLYNHSTLPADDGDD